MKFATILALIVLPVTIYGQNGNHQSCKGKCVAAAYCQNGTYKYDPKLAQSSNLVELHLNVMDECNHYLLRCCNRTEDSQYVLRADMTADESMEEPPSSGPITNVTCGSMNEKGLFYTMSSNETIALYGQYPWVVYIHTNQTTASNPLVASGTLIHHRLVITAAHNVAGKSNNLIARFGEWDVSTNNEPLPHMDIAILDVALHPSYINNPIENDIALLVLTAAVGYQPHIKPICLPEATDAFDGQRCISNGWGTVEGAFATTMKKLTLPVIPHGQCEKLLQNAGLGPFYTLKKGFMCAGGEKNVDLCHGDGGSPLACQRADGSFVLAGIVSFDLGCGGHSIPGAYVAVNEFLEWINHIVDKINESFD